ncbi:MAG: threonine synthase [Gemmatimonadales bacterium]|jgi:threonine synthase|nr:threonine synthase [Gemmatimonadales bacterium]
MRFQTQRPASWQVCTACGNEMVETDPHPRCNVCGGLLEIHHRPPTLTPAELLQRFTERRGGPPGATASGVWRFREIVLPSADAVVSYPEGNTPLLHRVALDRWSGVEHLLLKHEGHNPTGSFKDRGMTVGVTQARRIGATAVACASTGNTAASLAAYAAQGGLPALVLVPRDGVPTGKLAQALAYGAKTLLVRGDFDDCLRLVEEASEQLGVYLLNSINPFRIEGQKTIILELLQQLSWESPDWIIFPAGNLGNTAAFGKALREARAWGLIDRLPRLAAVQAAGAAPFARSFAEGFVERHRVKAATVATAIKIGNPASYDRAVVAIRETNGVVLSVPDAELLEAKAAIDASGVGCEPASAVSLAGLRQLVRSGEVKPAERVVAVLTGHILKDPDLLLRYHQEMEPPPPGANRPVEIEATLEAVERVLRETA